MGQRGPQSTAPGGYGTISAKGYRRVWNRDSKRYVMEHVAVWENVHGPVPPGYQLHHRNHDKLDNRIENLQLVNATEHKRIHSGCELRDGVWWKPCGRCDERKPVTGEHWYLSREGWPLYGRCRPCHIRAVVAAKRERRLR